jgi:hypothetical protein
VAFRSATFAVGVLLVIRWRLQVKMISLCIPIVLTEQVNDGAEKAFGEGRSSNYIDRSVRSFDQTTADTTLEGEFSGSPKLCGVPPNQQNGSSLSRCRQSGSRPSRKDDTERHLRQGGIRDFDGYHWTLWFGGK